MTVTAVSSSIYNTSAQTKTDSGAFTVTFANPCLNPQFVYIRAPTLTDYDEGYYVYDVLRLFEPHDPFEIITVPNMHNLCGDLSFIAKFDGQPVDGDPLDYDVANRQFKI